MTPLSDLPFPDPAVQAASFIEEPADYFKQSSDSELPIDENIAPQEMQLPPVGEENISSSGSMSPLSSWLDKIEVGYDNGFLIASKEQVDLGADDDKFRLRFNGWGQLRNTQFESDDRGRDIRQFQLKRARVVLSGSAFTEDFKYFLQFDGRSSDGDDLRLLDYFLSYDFGHHFLKMDKGKIGFRTGRWKMPFHLARWLSGREFEFTDRSVASTYFDVNRSLAWGLYGKTDVMDTPIDWEMAIFNGLVTGGAETGSSGTLDSNFAYSTRVFCYHGSDWGRGELADFDHHETLATRIGSALATSTIDKVGTTEFRRVRVVDTGERLADILPENVFSYRVFLYSVDYSMKYRGWSLTNEYYFRTIDNFRGQPIGQVFDHGHWIQIGKFVIPERLQFLCRWSRVEGDSGTLGTRDESSREISAAAVYYFNNQNAKLVIDALHVNGAPIDSAALDLQPGDDGNLFRTQIQFAF